MGGTISPLVKPNNPAAPATSGTTGPTSGEASASSAPASSAEASSSSLAGTAAVPPKSPWRNHAPSSPSPLSPSIHKVRSPRIHIAGGKRKAPKTPLSRLVLERAVLHRDKTAAGTGGVFGMESTRRTNVVVDKEQGKTELKVSTSVKLGQSVGPGKSNLAVSQSTGAKGAAAKSGKVWR